MKFFKILFLLVLIVALPVGVYLVGKQTGFFGRASGSPANLTIDAGLISESNFVWKNLAQGGEEPKNMFLGVEDKIKALEPNYIRIDHVYDYYQVITKNGNDLTFNWTKFDEVINTITSTGAKPFLSLTHEVPVDLTEWELMVQRTIEHVSGDLKISNVYYEIWNEPDLFGGFKTYGDRNYFELYAHSIIGANRVKNVLPYKIGGPATTALYENWATGFGKFILANNLRLDFYSWHKYSTNLDNFENNALNARSWLSAGGLPVNMELIISELGPDSKNNEVYDNNQGAIHEIAAMATVEDLVSKVFTFEIKDGPDLPARAGNKWGLLTYEGITKPRYNALLFLNNMTGNALNVSGEGSWVKSFAKKDNNIIRTLVVNYDPNGEHEEAVPINFINLFTSPPSGSKNFTFKRTDFNGGVIKNLQIATDSSSWSTLELMKPNTASIFEITL